MMEISKRERSQKEHMATFIKMGAQPKRAHGNMIAVCPLSRLPKIHRSTVITNAQTTMVSSMELHAKEYFSNTLLIRNSFNVCASSAVKFHDQRSKSEAKCEGLLDLVTAGIPASTRNFKAT